MDIVQSLAGFLAETTAKATLLLVVACVSARLLSRSSSSVRHRLWSLTMLSLILLPVASCALPSWAIPILPAVDNIEVAAPDQAAVPSSPTPPRIESSVPNEDTAVAHSLPQPIADGSEEMAGGEAGSTLLVSEQPPEGPRLDQATQPGVMTEVSRTSWTALSTVAIWSLGAGLLAILIVVNVARTIRFCRRSIPIVDGVWCRLLTELSQRLRLRRAVTLREHTEPIVPLTCGVLRPVVLLPPSAHDWDEPMQRTVLTHELAHVKRRDVVFQFIGRLACAMYWFHPLAWHALRKLRQEGEQACDDAVVHSGVKASDYAAQLLRVAELCCAPRGLSHGVAMAEGSNLELRVQSLFDSARRHGPVRKIVSVVMLLVSALTLGMTAVVDPVAATEQASPPEVQNPADTSTPAADAGVEASNPIDAAATQAVTSTPSKYPPKWLHGKDALARIIALKPNFGDERGGLKLGLAYATPQRVFHIGDRMPVEIFLMNVSDREVSTEFTIHSLFETPDVVNSQGERVSGPQVNLFTERPRHKVTLRPGEACVIPENGLELGGTGPVSFESPTVGRYRFSYRLVGLTSGSLQFEAFKEESGDLRIKGGYATLYSPERMSIIKPAFGKARRGIQMGLAFPTLRRTFAMGEKLPLEIYLRNVSDREQTIGFYPDFYWSPPSYVNPRGELQQIQPLPVWLFQPGLTLTLKPGEAYGMSTPGLWLSESRRGLSLVMPDVGTYRIEYTRTVTNDVEKSEYWHEDLQTAPLHLEVYNNKDGKRSVRLLAAGRPHAETPAAAQTTAQELPGAQADAPPPSSPPKPSGPEIGATPPPASPPPSEPKEDASKIALKNVIWWKKVKGLQAGFLLDSPGLPNRSVPFDSVVKYRVLVRNTTDKHITFMAQPVPNDYRDAPYLIPSNNIAEALDAPDLPDRFRATDGRQGWKYDLAYEMRLGPGESTIIPAHRGGDDLGLYVGKGDGKGLPTIRKVKAGMNWIVQPLQIWISTEPGYGTGVLFEGLYFQTRIDREGNARSEPATRSEGGKGGTILHPRIQFEVGTLNAAATRNAKNAIWGKVDKGLQCGIRLLDPQPSYTTGDTLEAELFWRNTSDKPIATPMPAKLDLYPMLHNADGEYVMIDFGARFIIKPGWSEFQPGAIRSLGVIRIALVNDGAPSPKSNAELGQVTLTPGTYKLSGSGGVSAPEGPNPRSGQIEFQVASRKTTSDAELEVKRKAAQARIEALGGEVTPYDKTTVAISLWKTKATDKDLEMIKCFSPVLVELTGTQITDAGLAHFQGMKRLSELDLHSTRITDVGLAHLGKLTGLARIGLSDTGVTSDGLRHLKPLKSLYMVSLNRTKITDAGLAHLSELPKIRTLIFDQTAITDDGLAHLSNLKSLHVIRLGSTQVTDKGLEYLSRMSELQTVDLSLTKVTGSGLSHLPPSVKTLWLPSTQVDDDGLNQIAHLTNLESLVLSNTKITDKGLQQLEKLSSLRKLQIERTKVTDAGVKRLKAAIPDCQVHR